MKPSTSFYWPLLIFAFLALFFSNMISWEVAAGISVAAWVVLQVIWGAVAKTKEHTA